MLISSGWFGTTIIEDPPPEWHSGPRLEWLDETYGGMIAELAETKDREQAHILADQHICGLLEQLNCHKTISAFKKLTKWYA